MFSEIFSEQYKPLQGKIMFESIYKTLVVLIYIGKHIRFWYFTLASIEGSDYDWASMQSGQSLRFSDTKE